MNAANFVWVVVACLFFTSVTCIGVAWAAVAMGKDYSAKLVQGLANRTAGLANAMGAVIDPEGNRESNGQRFNSHRVPEYTPPQRPTGADGR